MTRREAELTNLRIKHVISLDDDAQPRAADLLLLLTTAITSS